MRTRSLLPAAAAALFLTLAIPAWCAERMDDPDTRVVPAGCEPPVLVNHISSHTTIVFQKSNPFHLELPSLGTKGADISEIVLQYFDPDAAPEGRWKGYGLMELKTERHGLSDLRAVSASIDFIAPGDGTYALRTLARDRAGNMEQKASDWQDIQWMVVLDRTPPKLELLPTKAAEMPLAPGARVEVVWRSHDTYPAEPGSRAAALVEISRNGGKTWKELPDAEFLPDGGRLVWKVEGPDTDNLVFRVTVRDAAGNQTSAVSGKALAVQSPPPPALPEFPQLADSTKPEQTPEQKPEPKPEQKPEVKPETEPAPETKPVSEPKSEPEVKPETKPEVKPEAVSEPKTEPEVKPELAVKTEPKPEIKTEDPGTKPETVQTPKSEPTSEPEVESKPDFHPDFKFDPREKPEREPARHPAVAIQRYQTGVIYMNRGDLGEAAKYFEEAIRLDFKLAPAYVDLTATYLGLYDRDRALGLGYLDRAARAACDGIRAVPREVSLYYNLAQARYRLGRLDSAAASLDAGLAVEPRHIESLYLLALIRATQKRTNDAVVLWRQVAAIGGMSERDIERRLAAEALRCLAAVDRQSAQRTSAARTTRTAKSALQ